MNDNNFQYFDDQWNEPTTIKDERGDYYDTDFEQGVDEYVPKKDSITTIED